MSILIIPVLASALWPRKKKVIQFGKEKVELSIERHDHLCRKSDGSSKNLLELISGFSKVARYKIKIQKSIVFLYAHSESSEIEILKSTVHNSIKKYEILRNKCDKTL